MNTNKAKKTFDFERKVNKVCPSLWVFVLINNWNYMSTYKALNIKEDKSGKLFMKACLFTFVWSLRMFLLFIMTLNIGELSYDNLYCTIQMTKIFFEIRAMDFFFSSNIFKASEPVFPLYLLYCVPSWLWPSAQCRTYIQ